MFFPFHWEGGALCPVKWDYLPQALLFLTVWEIGRYYRISRLFMKLQGCLLFPESSKLSPCLFGVGKVMHYHFSLLGFLASVLPITFFFLAAPCIFQYDHGSLWIKPGSWQWRHWALTTGCCSVAKSCATLRDPMDCSTSGFPVLHYPWEFAQTHVHWVHDASQPSHPLNEDQLQNCQGIPRNCF